ncbi:PLP-dependent cysteine synthase family protein, partial [Mycobacteroides abscessus subsp. massiliense]
CGAFRLISEMAATGLGGSVVTLLADSGDRYADTYFNDDWVTEQGFDLLGPSVRLAEFEDAGRWD